MRLRGLPRDLICGNVDLVPAKDCPHAATFQTCSSCEFTCVQYYRLDCDHVHCESCLIFYHAPSDSPEVHCSVCNVARSATKEETALAALYMANFECPCGEEGPLHSLSRHRQTCRQSQRKQSIELDLSQASSSSSSFSSGVSSGASSSSSCTVRRRNSSEKELHQSLEFIVKGYVAQELNRMKEDVLNTTRQERQAGELSLQRSRDRIDYLDSRLNHFAALELRLETLERNANAPRSTDQLLQSRIERVDLQVQGLCAGDLVRKIAAQQFTRCQIRESFVWFDMKTLLRDYNRARSPTSTADQTLLLGGYPCRVNLQIEQEDGLKTLVVYIAACEALPYSANWPMRRQLTFRICDTQGNDVFRNHFSTTESECRKYFNGPDSPDFESYWGVEMCTTEEVTVGSFYQRNNGMICIGISTCPIGSD